MKWKSIGWVSVISLMAGGVLWLRQGTGRQSPAPVSPVPEAPPSLRDVLCRLPMPGPGGAVAMAPAPVPEPTVGPAPVAVASAVMPGLPMKRTASRLPPAAAVPVAHLPVADETPSVPDNAGESALENVQGMLRDFRTRMGGNPVGSNAEIMRAVMGGNPVQARLGPPPGQSLNADGELLDPWGTPYFFHQLSARIMEVRSAGPDRILWSPDDLESR